MPTRSIPWPRILAEGFAIVVSILLAFGIQAWWEERQERADESDALFSLLAELEANQEIAANSVSIHGRMEDAAARFGRISLGLEGMPDDSMLISLLLQSFAGYRTTNFQLGTVEALIASGDIGLVRNSQIRSDIAGLQSVLEDATEDERLALEVRQQFFLPFVLERVPSQLVGGRNGAAVLPPEITSQPAAAQVRSMLGDEELEALLGISVTIHDVARGGLERAEQYLDGLAERIREELRTQ